MSARAEAMARLRVLRVTLKAKAKEELGIAEEPKKGKAKKENWEVVCTELRKFGIKVSRDRKEKLI